MTDYNLESYSDKVWQGGCKFGREQAIGDVLEIIDELCTDEDNGKMIAGRMVYILASEFRDRVLALKGESNEQTT